MPLAAWSEQARAIDQRARSPRATRLVSRARGFAPLRRFGIFSTMKRTTPAPLPPEASAPAARVSRMASELVGSEILQIAAEIRARKGAGTKICNLTVGDFD